MGLIDFIKNAGKKLRLDDDDDKPQAQAKPAQQAPTPQQVQDLNDRKRAAATVRLIEGMGFHVDELGVRVDGHKATLTGTVDTQEMREKIVLMVGNVDGIGQVDDQIKVSKPEPEATFYEVKSGDTLSKIAKHHYGDANKYHQIFEANRPMLKDPDEIYPGQKLRIPAA